MYPPLRNRRLKTSDSKYPIQAIHAMAFSMLHSVAHFLRASGFRRPLIQLAIQSPRHPQRYPQKMWMASSLACRAISHLRTLLLELLVMLYFPLSMGSKKSTLLELGLLVRVARGEFDATEEMPAEVEALLALGLVEQVPVFAYPIQLTMRYRYQVTEAGYALLAEADAKGIGREGRRMRLKIWSKEGRHG